MRDLMQHMIRVQKRYNHRKREMLGLRGKWARMRMEKVARGATELGWRVMINELKREHA